MRTLFSFVFVLIVLFAVGCKADPKPEARSERARIKKEQDAQWRQEAFERQQKIEAEKRAEDQKWRAERAAKQLAADETYDATLLRGVMDKELSDAEKDAALRVLIANRSTAKEGMYFRTAKGRTDATRLREEITKQYADRRAKAESILVGIARQYGIEKAKPEAEKFCSTDQLQELVVLEQNLRDKDAKVAADVLKVAKDTVKPPNGAVFWFLVNGRKEIVQRYEKEEQAAEWKRRTAEVEARKADAVAHQDDANHYNYRLAFAPDGKSLAVMNGLGLKIWEVTTGKEIRTIDRATGWEIGGLSWSPDGQNIAAAIGHGSFRIYETSSGKIVREISGVGRALPVTDLLWKEEGLVACGMKQEASVYGPFPELAKIVFIDEAGARPRALDVKVRDGRLQELLLQGPNLIRIDGQGYKVVTPDMMTGFEIKAFHPATETSLWLKKKMGVAEVRRGEKVISTFSAPSDDDENVLVRFSQDGRFVVVGLSRGPVVVHNVTTGKEVFRARYGTGSLHGELESLSGPELQSVALHSTRDELFVAAGGMSPAEPVKIYRHPMKK